MKRLKPLALLSVALLAVGLLTGCPPAGDGPVNYVVSFTLNGTPYTYSSSDLPEDRPYIKGIENCGDVNEYYAFALNTAGGTDALTIQVSSDGDWYVTVELYFGEDHSSFFVAHIPAAELDASMSNIDEIGAAVTGTFAGPYDDGGENTLTDVTFTFERIANDIQGCG